MNSRGKTHLKTTTGMNSGKQRKGNFSRVVSKLPARSKDNFLLLMLFAMGLSGFVYIITIPLKKGKKTSSILSSIINGEKGMSMTSNFIKSNLLSISGEANTSSPMTFDFNGLTEKGADYEIYFGDRCILSVDKGSVEHTYSKAGTYKVELKKICKGSVYTVHCDYINIR